MTERLMKLLDKFLEKHPLDNGMVVRDFLTRVSKLLLSLKALEDTYKDAYTAYVNAKHNYEKAIHETRKQCLHEVTEDQPGGPYSNGYTECMICGKEIRP